MAPYTNVFTEYAVAQGGSSRSRPRPIRTMPPKTRCSTTIAMPPAWIATMGMGRSRSGIFLRAPLIRVSQKNVPGINATDGTSVLTPAVNQYENCLRCHGTSSGKQVLPIYGYFPVRAVSAGDPLNLIPQFARQLPSSHPVMHARSSSFPQPSLLPNMLNLDGAHAGPRHGHADSLHRLPQQRRQSRIRRHRRQRSRTDRGGRTFWSAAMNSARRPRRDSRSPICFPIPI